MAGPIDKLYKSLFSFDYYENPLKDLLHKTLEEKGLDAPILTIGDMSDSEVLKALKDLGVQPKIQKNMGGIVSLNQLTRPLGMM